MKFLKVVLVTALLLVTSCVIGYAQTVPPPVLPPSTGRPPPPPLVPPAGGQPVIQETVTAGQTNRVQSADGSITVTVPKGAVDTDAKVTVVRISETMYDISFRDATGNSITEFSEPLVLGLFLAPEAITTIPTEELVIVFWDESTQTWIPIPTTVDRNTGQISGAITHLSTFMVLRVGSVTQRLMPGWNIVTFTGPTGTPVARIAEEVGSGLESVGRFNAKTQRFDSINPLTTLRQRDALLLKMSGSADWTTTNLIPAPGGSRKVILQPGLNVIGYTGPDDLNIAGQLLDSEVARSVISVWIFDSSKQEWFGFFPGSPPFVNRASKVDRLNGIFILAKSKIEMVLPEVR